MAAIASEVKRCYDLFFFSWQTLVRLILEKFPQPFFAGDKEYYPQCLERCYQIGKAVTDFLYFFFSTCIFSFPVDIG